MTREQRNKLPKAKWLNLQWTSAFYFARFRLANATRVQIGRLCLIWRMPWLEGPARALHPQIFQDRPVEADEKIA